MRCFRAVAGAAVAAGGLLNGFVGGVSEWKYMPGLAAGGSP